MQILSGMPSHRYRTKLDCMMILPVAAVCAGEKPAVVFNLSEDFPDFHVGKILVANIRRLSFGTTRALSKVHLPPSPPGDRSEVYRFVGIAEFISLRLRGDLYPILVPNSSLLRVFLERGLPSIRSAQIDSGT